jgi:hypothetical protein
MNLNSAVKKNPEQQTLLLAYYHITFQYRNTMLDIVRCLRYIDSLYTTFRKLALLPKHHVYQQNLRKWAMSNIVFFMNQQMFRESSNFTALH